MLSKSHVYAILLSLSILTLYMARELLHACLQYPEASSLSENTNPSSFNQTDKLVNTNIDRPSRFNPQKKDKNSDKTIQKKDIQNISNINASNNVSINVNEPENNTNLDSLNMVATTINNYQPSITHDIAQRINNIADTLNDQSLEALSSYIDTLASTFQTLNLDDSETKNKCFSAGLESYALLQQYIENPNIHIVAQPDINTHIFNARKDALCSVAHNPIEQREQSYILNADAHVLLTALGINPTQFTYCIGNEVQHQIHTEVVTILNEVINIPFTSSTQPLLDTATTYAYVIDIYAQKGITEKAFSLANCAWAALDCAKALYQHELHLRQNSLA